MTATHKQLANLERWQREQREARCQRELVEGVENLHAGYRQLQTLRPTGLVALDTKEAQRGRQCVILLCDSVESVELMRCEDELRYVVIPKLLAELDRLRNRKTRRRAA